MNTHLSYQIYKYEKAIETNETFQNKKTDKSFNYKRKLKLIYIHYNKTIISEDDRKIMNEIIIESHNFLHVAFSPDFFELQNNNINENNLANDFIIPLTTTETIIKNKDYDENNTLSEFLNILKLPFVNSYENDNIIPTNLRNMFLGCSSLISISGISK